MKSESLTAEILITAYAQGFFPMPDAADPRFIRWYRPDPRAIIPLDTFHISRSMRRVLKRHDLDVRMDQNFERIMHACAHRPETWITSDFIRVYCHLHALGFAHSVEIFRADQLVGGVYGVSLGAVFFAESMFHSENNMSKFALFKLVEHLNSRGFQLLECQFLTEHLRSLGACEVSDIEYMARLENALLANVTFA